MEKYGAYAKCNPALRKKEEIDKLWDYVNDGTVDFIGSDHSPYLVSEKEKSPDDIFVACLLYTSIWAGFGPSGETRTPGILLPNGAWNVCIAFLDLICYRLFRCVCYFVTSAIIFFVRFVPD